MATSKFYSSKSRVLSRTPTVLSSSYDLVVGPWPAASNARGYGNLITAYGDQIQYGMLRPTAKYGKRRIVEVCWEQEGEDWTEFRLQFAFDTRGWPMSWEALEIADADGVIQTLKRREARQTEEIVLGQPLTHGFRWTKIPWAMAEVDTVVAIKLTG